MKAFKYRPPLGGDCAARLSNLRHCDACFHSLVVAGKRALGKLTGKRRPQNLRSPRVEINVQSSHSSAVAREIHCTRTAGATRGVFFLRGTCARKTAARNYFNASTPRSEKLLHREIIIIKQGQITLSPTPELPPVFQVRFVAGRSPMPSRPAARFSRSNCIPAVLISPPVARQLTVESRYFHAKPDRGGRLSTWIGKHHNR